MPDSLKFDIRAVALILRKRDEKYELLAQSFVQDPSISWRFPGGGIKENETIDDGLLREVLEESGIENLLFIRKLGVQRYYKPYLSCYVERHDFLFLSEQALPDSWKHIVRGDGNDAGEVFQFQWIDSDEIYHIDVELQKFLDSNHLPEFFGNS